MQRNIPKMPPQCHEESKIDLEPFIIFQNDFVKTEQFRQGLWMSGRGAIVVVVFLFLSTFFKEFIII